MNHTVICPGCGQVRDHEARLLEVRQVALRTLDGAVHAANLLPCRSCLRHEGRLLQAYAQGLPLLAIRRACVELRQRGVMVVVPNTCPCFSCGQENHTEALNKCEVVVEVGTVTETLGRGDGHPRCDACYEVYMEAAVREAKVRCGN